MSKLRAILGSHGAKVALAAGASLALAIANNPPDSMCAWVRLLAQVYEGLPV